MTHPKWGCARSRPSAARKRLTARRGGSGNPRVSAECPARYDVVVAAGVLHCFADPVVIMMELCRVARHALCLEVTSVEMIESGCAFDGSPEPIYVQGAGAVCTGQTSWHRP